MSDYTYARSESYDTAALSSAAANGYNFVINDVLGLARPLEYQFGTEPRLAQTQARLDLTARKLCASTSPTLAATSNASVPLARGPRLNNSGAPHLNLTTPQVLHQASPLVRQSFELLARAEITAARAQAVTPAAAPLPSVLHQLQRAELALDKGDAQAALLAAQSAAQAASALEAELARAAADHTSAARGAADALARAGGLWSSLHSQPKLREQAVANQGASLGDVETRLRACREAYADGRFGEVVNNSARLQTELNAMIERAHRDAQEQHAEHMATQIKATLEELAFSVCSERQGQQLTLRASRNGRERMTIALDGAGGFTVDTRHFNGAPACSVETNAFLRELAERLSFEVEDRQHIAHPDAAPGAVARTNQARGALALNQAIEKASRRSTRASVPPATAAAWARISR